MKIIRLLEISYIFLFAKRTLNSSYTNQKKKKKKLAEQIAEIITKLEDIFYF